MANRRNRIIYASQSVHAEGRILYRVRTFGSTTTFNTTDIFQLGQLNLVDIVDDSPEVAVTLEGRDYGSIYTMATLAKVPTANLNHNIRQSDGVTFFGTVGGVDVSTGTVSGSVPAASGTGIANIVVKDASGSPLAYLHGVQLIDFGRDCGVTKGVDIWSPIQSECALGSAANEIEFTKVVKDVYINKLDLNYQSTDVSNENYTGVTEQKQWLLNSARFLSWEEWHVSNLPGDTTATAMGLKTQLKLSLAAPSVVATLEDKSLGFLKKDLAGRVAVLFTFVEGGGLIAGESAAVPVFSNAGCIPNTVTEYFLYDATSNTLSFYANGLPVALSNVLPAGRSAFINGDKIYLSYAANAYAEAIGSVNRPVGADSSVVSAEYFAPISTNDVEDIGAVRQGQIEAYLVDPDLITKLSLAGATIGANTIMFNGTVSANTDLTKFIGLNLSVTDGPGKNGPVRAIVAASNNLVGSYNNGSLTLGGSDWAALRLIEDPSRSSTNQLVYVESLCGVDSAYVGSNVTVVVSGVVTSAVIGSVDTSAVSLTLSAPVSGLVDDGSQVLLSTEPTVASTVLLGGYELTLRLQDVNLSADLAREALKEIGHLNPYARTLTIPIKFTASVNTTASDLQTFATFAGKLGNYKNGTLTNLDIVDILSKDNLAIVVMVYQQTDREAGGTGVDRKVLSPRMFGDEYFVNGVRNVYTAVDGSLREYPLKTVIVQNLRPTDEAMSTPLEGNATQTFAYRGTNQLTAVRGYVGIDLASQTIESQGK
jgi:hypothetical protein